MAACSIAHIAITAERLFAENAEWAKAIARNVARKLPPSFDPGDLQQEALAEHWKRCQLYDPDNAEGTPYQGYAYVHVRGAVLMSIRRRNWIAGTAEAINDNEVDRGHNPEEQVHTRQEDKVEQATFLQRHAWLLEQISLLPSLEAYLVKRVFIDELDIDDVARVIGVERVVLSRRLAVAVQRLHKARKKA